MSFNPFDTTRGDQEMELQATAGMVNDYEREIAALKNERDSLTKERDRLREALEELTHTFCHGQEIAQRMKAVAEAALKGAK